MFHKRKLIVNAENVEEVEYQLKKYKESLRSEELKHKLRRELNDMLYVLDHNGIDVLGVYFVNEKNCEKKFVVRFKHTEAWINFGK